MVTHVRFTPNVIGEYVLRCAELCGTNHGGMLATVRVVSAEEFKLWQSEQLAPTPGMTLLHTVGIFLNPFPAACATRH